MVIDYFAVKSFVLRVRYSKAEKYVRRINYMESSKGAIIRNFMDPRKNGFSTTRESNSPSRYGLLLRSSRTKKKP